MQNSVHFVVSYQIGVVTMHGSKNANIFDTIVVIVHDSTFPNVVLCLYWSCSFQNPVKYITCLY